jgi:hypothetical protein
VLFVYVPFKALLCEDHVRVAGPTPVKAEPSPAKAVAVIVPLTVAPLLDVPILAMLL